MSSRWCGVKIPTLARPTQKGCKAGRGPVGRPPPACGGRDLLGTIKKMIQALPEQGQNTWGSQSDVKHFSALEKNKTHSMAEQSAEIPSQFIDGVRVNLMYDADCVRSAINYKPRPDDVFISTYPKCGTTWAQHILLLIFRHGEPLESQMTFFTAAPFLEIAGAKGAESMPRPGALKTHLPFRVIPWSDEAKYVYLTRNPKDCCVSYYHHMKDLPFHGFAGDFNNFFELFISGNVDFGDYFDHVLEWYEHRNDPNVLFMTYEEMKEDPEAAILKMASFIGEEQYAKPLREDPAKLKNVLEYSSFKHMKVAFNTGMDKLFHMTEEDLSKIDFPDEVKKLFARLKENVPQVSAPPPTNFVRKGIIGDWKNHFTEEQSKRLDEKFAERMQGTELESLWKKYM
ncbi:Sulfotransferase 1C2A [Araneus ventricosus]|uniref:Sulfotransferase 1C2A n=1 Tax=Araneus ventricosus TaxID=182803 RepID=A0A4Y2HY14_ARAVE|nr:Sulfotransferase 1C2A [Araneus ventricosus]